MDISINLHLDTKYGKTPEIRTKQFDTFSVIKIENGSDDIGMFIESHETVNELMNALKEVRDHIIEREIDALKETKEEN